MVPYVDAGACYGVDSVAPPGNQAVNGEHKQIPKGREDYGGKARGANLCRGKGGRKVETGG